MDTHQEAAPAAQSARVETGEYAAMMRRMLRGWERRLGDSDIPDLAELARFNADVDRAQRNVVSTWRAAGRPWSEIGAAFGITRQSAQERFGH